MSHFTQIKTQISDLDCLKRALEYMGLQYEEGENITLKGHYGDSKGQLAVRKRNLPGRLGTYTDLGFAVKEDGTYEIVMDDFFPDEATKFVNSLTQRYAREVIVQNMSWQGYTVESENVEADGTVRLVVSQW